MALSILDGNQSATTLSTILSSGQHITAHTVVSLGTQAITDMRGAVSGSVVSISSLPAISGTVTVGVLPSLQNSTDFVGVGEQIAEGINNYSTIPVAVNWQDANQGIGNLNVTATCVTSTNRIGVVTIGGGTVTIGAGTAQIGSVTASISNFPATQAVSLTTLPALVAGTAQIGSVTASISNSVVTFYPMQGTTVSNTNFTSITASTTLVSAVANREVLTVFNEGAGNLHISPGATCTTVAYQVRLSAGDYWECPQGQLSLAHTAVFATAGTARVCQVS
jgi:hypothetical protein